MLEIDEEPCHPNSRSTNHVEGKREKRFFCSLFSYPYPHYLNPSPRMLSLSLTIVANNLFQNMSCNPRSFLYSLILLYFSSYNKWNHESSLYQPPPPLSPLCVYIILGGNSIAIAFSWILREGLILSYSTSRSIEMKLDGNPLWKRRGIERKRRWRCVRM